MKVLLTWSILAICCAGFCLDTHTTELIPTFDTSFKDVPKRFRITNNLSNHEEVSTRGLDRLAASGSGQFFEEGFMNILEKIPNQNIVVIDLREESHGLINGKPVSWRDGIYNSANSGKTVEAIENDETARLENALCEGYIQLQAKNNELETLVITNAQTERKFVESLGLTYMRLPVTDHYRPTDETVDCFVKFVQSLPPEQWLHLHCKAGSGRTTTFLTLYDMIINANEVSFSDILTRQNMLGGKDLAKLAETIEYKQEAATERLEFLKKFYMYCQQVPDFSMNWSEWIKNTN